LRDKYQSIVAVAPPPTGGEPATPPPVTSKQPGAADESGPFYRREAPAYDPFLTTAVPPASDHTVEMVDGVYHVFEPGASDVPMLSVPNVAQFYVDYFALRGIVNSGPVKTFAYKRLQILEERFSLHVMLNGHKEGQEQKSVPHRDFYNVRKVDTHVHLAAAMNQVRVRGRARARAWERDRVRLGIVLGLG